MELSQLDDGELFVFRTEPGGLYVLDREQGGQAIVRKVAFLSGESWRFIQKPQETSANLYADVRRLRLA